MTGADPDVLVVGAGIIGLACAHALLEEGLSVSVVDRGLPGAGQSTRTGGGIRLLHGSAVPTELTRRSLPTWRGFADRFGIDPRYRETGHLFLTASDGGAVALAEQRAAQAALGVPAEVLARDEIVRRWPALRATTLATGLHCPVGGYLDHHRVVCGYVRAVERRGGQVLAGTRVDALERSGGRVTGAQTSTGTISAGVAVVNAAGAQAGVVAAMAGHDIPFVARRHQLLIVGPAGVPDELPWLIDVDAQVHLRPDGGGRALIGGFLGRDEASDPRRYDRGHDDDWARRVRAAAARSFGITPPRSPIIEGWAGLYPGTQDYLPVVEVSQPGLVTAAGFAGTGLMHAPAVGELVAGLLTGHVDDLVQALGSGRFAGEAPVVERTGF